MTTRLWVILAAMAVILSGGCSSDDSDPVVPPDVDIFEAYGDFYNFLVGDGTVDTRMDVRLGTNLHVASDIPPNGGERERALILAAEQETASIGIYLTAGDGSVLNDGEQFPLTKDRHYVFMALGHVDETQGSLKPSLLQLAPLASPGISKVQFRFVHALAGTPDPIDVHVNGQVITNIQYGSASPAATFDARPVGQDSLLVVPTGVTPDGDNEIWKSTGHILFFMDSHYDGVLTHHPRSIFDGDVTGQAEVVLLSDTE